MAFREGYQKQVQLLVRALPGVAEEKDFALKGGTAINLFVRDFPRLSVDIDLTFLPVLPRAESIVAINAGMARIAQRLRTGIASVHVHAHKTPDGVLTRLVARQDGVQIKIEINPVMRGSVYDPVVMRVAEKVEAIFGYAEARLVSQADLYAGKLMAALDRQHPRDLFDVRELLAREGISEELRRAFIVYLISHDRPMAEVLRANLKDIEDEYERGFVGMTEDDVPIESLLAARQQMIDLIVGDMPADHRAFLISFERGTPDWSLLGLPAARDLPAVRWRQLNLDKLTKDKREALVTQLQKVIGS